MDAEKCFTCEGLVTGAAYAAETGGAVFCSEECRDGAAERRAEALSGASQREWAGWSE